MTTQLHGAGRRVVELPERPLRELVKAVEEVLPWLEDDPRDLELALQDVKDELARTAR